MMALRVQSGPAHHMLALSVDEHSFVLFSCI
jgi:hypothetical protein